MSRIAIVAYETNPAVCSSMMMHVDMMADCGHDIVMLIQNKVDMSLFKDYSYKKDSFEMPSELSELFSKYKTEKIWCTNVMYFIKLVRLTKLPIYLWKQGDAAAESFMAHHSYLRKWVLQLIDAYALRKVAGVIYVSDAMKEYYENKYGVRTKSIVVPCLSEFANSKVENVERIPNSFVYIGGLSVWQCFDEILKLYAKIRTNKSVFHIITLNTEAARKKVIDIIGDDKNIDIYGITDRTQIPATLNKFEYGFLIRKNDVVNQVAAPIKFLEYLSCGVNVIMTDAVPSYAKLVKENNVGTVVDMNAENITINPYNPNAKEVYKKYFNRESYVDKYKTLLLNK